MNTTPRMRIGEVHTLLRQEFPTIELSKIRYYEDKGLVCPSRSRKGYRLYSDRDIECLREAFRLAQQEFVPLRVIRQRLIEQGLLPDRPVEPTTKRAAKEVAASAVISLAVPPNADATNVAERRVPTMRLVRDDEPTSTLPGTDSTDDADARLGVVGAALVRDGVTASEVGLVSRRDFLDQSGLSEADMADLIGYGFVQPFLEGGVEHFSREDVAVARDFGTLTALGVEARHLQIIRRTVEREVELLAQLTQPIVQTRRGHDKASVERDVEGVSESLQAFRRILYNASLREHLRTI